MGSSRKFSIETYRASSRRHYVFRIVLHRRFLGSESFQIIRKAFALRHATFTGPLRSSRRIIIALDAKTAPTSRDRFYRSRSERCSLSLASSIYPSLSPPPDPGENGERSFTDFTRDQSRVSVGNYPRNKQVREGKSNDWRGLPGDYLKANRLTRHCSE